MYALRGGAVPVPSWILLLRAFQLFFAILALAMCAYSLSVYGGGPLQPALISMIIISCLTLIPILLLTTPLHMAQRKVYDPRIALLLDGFACLFWLASFAALASYQHIYKRWGRDFTRFDIEFDICRECRYAWRTGVAATVFGGVEFILFLITSLAFIYYYHLHLSEHPSTTSTTSEGRIGHGHKPSVGATSTSSAAHPNTHPSTATGTTGIHGTGAGLAAAEAGTHPHHHHHTHNSTATGTESHPMSEIPHPAHQNPLHSNGPGVGSTPYNSTAARLSGSHMQGQQAPMGQGNVAGPPYPTGGEDARPAAGQGNIGYGNV